MSQELNQEGTFRGRIIEYGLQEGKDTQSVGVAIKCEIDEAFDFDSKEWLDWREHRVQCYGYVNIVKGDGVVNTKSAENLCKCTGWNGHLDDIVGGTWKPNSIQFSTKADTYKEKTSYKVDYINEYDRIPGGGIRSVEPAKAKTLQAKHGAALRAVAANASRNSQVANGKPKPPPPTPMPKNDNRPVPNTTANGAPTDDIPF